MQSGPVTRTGAARRRLDRRLVPLGGTLGTLGLFIGMWTVVTPEVEAALGGGPGRLGLVLTGALLLAAWMNTLGGALAERRGTSAALRLTLAWWAVALAAGAVAPAPWGVALGIAAALSGSGAVDVVANVGATAALADRPGRLVRLHALFNVGGALGAVLAAVLLALSATSGWRIAWAASAVVVAALLATTRGVELPAGHAGEHVPLSDGMRTLRRERLVPVALAFALAATVEGGINTWGVLQLRGQLDAGLVVGAGGAVLGYLIAVLARVSVSGVQTHRSARRVVVGGSMVAAVGLAMLASLTQPVLAAAGLVMAAGGVSVCWPLLMSEVGRGRERPGAIVGAVSTVGYLGIVLGPGAVGLVAGAFGLSTGLWLLAGAAVGIPAMLALARR